MKIVQNKTQTYIHAVFIVIALIIIADFILPGRVIEDDIIEVNRELEKYYNAGGNYHYSYNLVTSSHQFSVDEAFANSLPENGKIVYSVSPIVNEVNWYKLQDANRSTSYSLRTMTGVLVPVICVLVLLASLFYTRKIGTLVLEEVEQGIVLFQKDPVYQSPRMEIDRVESENVNSLEVIEQGSGLRIADKEY